MSAERNLHPRVKVKNLGWRYTVEVDGHEVAAVPHGPFPSQFGGGGMSEDIASIVTDIIANTVGKSLPSGPVILSIPAEVVIHVEEGAVSEVHVLPSQAPITEANLYEANGHTVDEVIHAAKLADTTVWQPVADANKAPGFVWEG